MGALFAGISEPACKAQCFGCGEDWERVALVEAGGGAVCGEITGMKPEPRHSQTNLGGHPRDYGRAYRT